MIKPLSPAQPQDILPPHQLRARPVTAPPASEQVVTKRVLAPYERRKRQDRRHQNVSVRHERRRQADRRNSRRRGARWRETYRQENTSKSALSLPQKSRSTAFLTYSDVSQNPFNAVQKGIFLDEKI